MIGHSPAAAVRSRALVALRVALALVIGLAILARVPSIAEPLGIDQSLWASAVRGMSRGQLLYVDVWEQRPPGIYWIYLLAFTAFGWAASTVAWLDILASAATAVLLVAIGRASARPLSGLLAGAFYAVLTMPAWLYGYGGFLERSVCETFIVVAVGLAFWCALKLSSGGGLGFAALLGLAAGAAVVLKPNAGLYFPAALIWLACYVRRPGGSWRPFVTIALVAAAWATVAPLAAALWLWGSGMFGEAIVAVVQFNRFYVAEGFDPGAYLVDFSKAVWLRMKTDPLWLAGSAGAVFAVAELVRARRLSPLAGLAMCWGGAAVIVIVVNGARLFNSYFIQALAPLALMAVWFLGEAVRRSFLWRLAAAATLGLMAMLLVQRGYADRVGRWMSADLDLLRGRVDRAAYLELFGGYDNRRGYSARANDELAAYIRARSAPADRIFLFGINGAGVYYAADRLTAHRFLRVNFYVETAFPDPRFRLESVVADLSRRRPLYLVFERLNSQSAMGKAADALPEHPAVLDLLRGYRMEARIEDFSIYRRVD